jgi:hypothetical protein
MIYKLFVKANKDCILYPSDLEYFQSHFVCQKMAEPWSPPKFTVARKTRPLRDFVSWELGAPVISSRALTVLSDLIAPHCQVLEFDTIKGIDLYCLNVLTCYSDPEALPEEPPGIFKIKSLNGNVFVNQTFVKTVIDNRLYGAGFTKDLFDPTYIFDPDINDLDHWIHDPKEKKRAGH